MTAVEHSAARRGRARRRDTGGMAQGCGSLCHVARAPYLLALVAPQPGEHSGGASGQDPEKQFAAPLPWDALPLTLPVTASVGGHS